MQSDVVSGTARAAALAHARSFARLCAGTADVLLDLAGAPDPGDRLLDVGTGTGTVAAAARRRGWVAVGVDPDRAVLDLVRRQEDLPLVAAALPRLPHRSGAVDAATANFVVNHVPDPRAATAELLRVVRPGGSVAVTVWPAGGDLARLWADVLAAAGVAAPPSRSLPPALDFDRTAPGLVGLLRDAGGADADAAEVGWVWRVGPADLWAAVEHGLAVVGRTYQAQPASGRRRLRAAFEGLAAERAVDGELRLAVRAVAGVARRSG
ncbi:class I SAM-dependent methyltransferase [Microlunatus capsulatus]|uniref:SAM-dependent methyltransferase n=1 Tax=Microlunatus capsulatus TaxID=99117 RepID=A0ABS4ZAB7_9ACTN|nr:class I SAM-dependent methyltransferase [Microlunatus capsulatus]MBP2417657.1 SAM-dependent methyltransferase [Microlunatus capsulatus]